MVIIVLRFYRYTAFALWSVATFFQNYTEKLVALVLYVCRNITKRTKIVKLQELDLVWEKPIFDVDVVRFWAEPGQLVGIERRKTTAVKHDA